MSLLELKSAAEWGKQQGLLSLRPRPAREPWQRPAPAGYMPLKQWVVMEAERQGVTPSGVWKRYYRVGYPQLKLKRVNKRTVFVRIPEDK